MKEITEILDNRKLNGDPDDALIAAVYAQLKLMAKNRMVRERRGHTLQATALVHEAWLRIGNQDFANRKHFFYAVSEAMRRILVDNARRKQAARRGGEFIRVDDAEIDEFPSNKNLDDLVAINEILEKLAEIDPRKAQLVKLRYFVGMTGEEVAETMDMSLTTVNRDWAFARAWLYKELNK
jgi:RNA polymerase sigma factor (TIGR02999 family)